MKKKILSLFTVLCLMTLLIAIPSVVQADYANKWTEDFENETSGGIEYSKGSYYVSSGDDGLFIYPNSIATDNVWSKHLELSPDGGVGGTRALRIHCDESQNGTNWRGAHTALRGITLKENTAVVLRYKIKYTKLPTAVTSSGASIHLSSVLGGKKYININDAAIRGTISYFQLGKWYTIVTKVTGTGATKATTSYIWDETGALTHSETRNVTITIPSGVEIANQPIYMFPVVVPELSTQSELYLDDVSLTEIKTDNTENIAFDAIGSNIANGATGVALNKTFRIAFDHDLASTAADTVKLYKKSDTEKKSPIAYTVSAKAFDSFLLTPSGLEPNTEYVLDFSGVTSSAGAAISQTSQSISFKTVDPGETPIEPVKFVSAAATSGNFTDGTYSNAALTDAFTLNFDSAILEPTYGTAVKLYKTADTSKTAIAATITMSDDAKSFVLTPSAALSLGTNYTIDFAVVMTSLGGTIEGTSAITFTTIASRGTLYVTDDLEAAATINGSLSGSNYKTSNILDYFSSYTSVADGAGVDGSKGIKIDNTSSSGSTVSISSKSFDLDESETLFVEYKLNIKDVSVGDTASTNQAGYFTISNANSLYPGSSNAIFKFIKDTDSTTGNTYYPMTNNGQSRKMTWDADEYYTVVMMITRTAQNGYVYDEEGNLLLEASLEQNLNDSVKVNWLSINSNKNILNMNLDDFKVSRVQNETLDPIDSECTVTNGAIDIATTGDIKLVFNQPLYKVIKANEVFSLYEGDNKVNATIRRNGGNEIIITPAQSLDAGITYTINVANTLTSLSEKAYSGPTAISFTTKSIYKVNAKNTTLAITEDGSIVAGDKTFVVDNVGDVVLNPILIVAVYADHRLDRLIGCEVFDIDSLTARENTLKFTLANSYADAGSVKILIFDSIEVLKPIMKAYNITK